MKPGAFAIGLTVKDINAPKQFHEHLDFTVFTGGPEKKYLILKNINALIRLFQVMFQGNILTFNPVWDENAANIKTFDDGREIQRPKGIALLSKADEQSTGPASFMTSHPDGNIILLDQHR